MTRKKLYGLISIIIALLLLAGSYAYYSIAYSGRYNQNPDLEAKVVGSKNFSGDWQLPETIDDVIKNAEVIIIGTVLDDGEEYRFDFAGGEITKAINNKTGYSTLLPCTYSSVHVDEVLGGEVPETDKIRIFQFGKPIVPDVQTKLRKGERLLMLLQKQDTPENYVSLRMEDTMFYLDENDIVTAMSDQLVCARYDGRPKELLIDDLMNTAYYKQFF